MVTVLKTLEVITTKLNPVVSIIHFVRKYPLFPIMFEII